MLRIVGGEQRGRRIQLLPGGTVRPTPQRVREALFNLLNRLVPGREVYDLFAGSGALGIESLSRGAATAVFVERDRRVAAVLRHNLRTLGYDKRATVAVCDAYHYVAVRQQWPAEPAVVLVAPPYAHFQRCFDKLYVLCETIIEKMPGNTAIAIQAPRQLDLAMLPAGPDWDLRRYGDTQLIVCQTLKNS